MRGPIWLATTAVLITSTVLTIAHFNSGPEASAAVGAMTWHDEFDGPAGSEPDTSKWKHDVGGGGFGNNELEYYTDGNKNAALDGSGNLVITARKENPANYQCHYGYCQYTSARLLTAGKFTQQYGRFEARMKIPRGQGIWPAFWAMGPDPSRWPANGEIDIMENVGKEPGTVHGSLHGPGYSGGNPLTGTYTLPNGKAFADDFHTFAVDWNRDSITWYVDNIQYSRHVRADAGSNPWVFDQQFFMIMNLAVGGNWPGSPDGSTSFPQQMIVDYVRVYADGAGNENPTGPTGAITGFGGKCVDVDGAKTANGTAVQLYDCNGTNAQKWTLSSDRTIRALGKCLDVTDGSTANGALVQLYDCNGSEAQKWVFSSAKDLVNPQANKCLDAKDTSSANGTRLQIWECGGTANQKWNVPA
jgi:beta-glucanase (GH16 family)